MISVIIPVYNSEKTLSRSIESILSQHYGELEIVLVDDGSTDSSSNICNEWANKDPRVRVYHQANGGVSVARNKGLEVANGEWLTFVDSDDYIEQGYFPEIFDYSIDLYVQNWRVFGGGDAPWEQLDYQVVKGEEMVSFMERYGHLDLFRMVAAKFIKREIVNDNQIRFNSQVALGEDTLFFMEYYRHCSSLCVLDSAHYMYYRPKANWSDKYKIREDKILAFEKSFWEQYQRTPYKCPKLLEFACTWFYYAVDGRDKILKKLRWIYNPAIMAMRMEILKKDVMLFLKYQIKSTINIKRY